MRLSKPIRWLNKPPARKLNAARAIVVRPDLPAIPVQMVATASTDSQASPVIVVQRPLAESSKRIIRHQTVHAMLQREIPVRKDREDPTDRPAMLVLQALMDNQAAQALLVNQVPPDHPVKMALPVHKVTLAKPPVPLLALLVNPVPTANPALLALLVNQVVPAKMAALALPVLPAMLALQATLAKLALPARKAIPAKTDHPAAATTAHQLVWLQVGKHPLRSYFGSDIEYGAKIVSNRFLLSSTFSFAMLAFSCVFSGKA